VCSVLHRVIQMLREKCLALEDDVHKLTDRLKQAQDVIAEKDCHIVVCDVGFFVELCNVLKLRLQYFKL